MFSFSCEDAGAIKAATAASIEAVGGVSRAADALSIGSSTLTKYASPNEEWRQNFIRLDLAVRLDRASGHPFLLESFSGLVRRDGVHAPADVTPTAVLRLNAILDDVVREVATAIDDSRIDAGERLAIRKRIVAAQRELARLDALMR
ncbi:phage regulatory CII family protein [Ciceribacter ferrooxidans]|uniref:Uncharacterized protein n=1 Tax=Ciceribacter ferrooxidans TaxID=2509717 RepID=A0A4Q2SW32_9HYPH|nr:phage regulatory CII family protein [Ciceribacter ferrooxidans]RYC10052.1 hypothetical protein EUU22_18420 [Ciceribacter ferrooxidans]